MFVQVSRTVSGQTQSQTIPLDVVGVLDYESADRLYAPLALVQQLDQWCSHKIGSLEGESVQAEIEYSHCFAYVPRAYQQRVETEAERLNIGLDLEGEVMAYDAPPYLWTVVEDPQGNSPVQEVERIAAAFDGELHPVQTFAWPIMDREFKVVALSANDPRWRHSSTHHAPEFGQAFSATEFGEQPPGFLGPLQIVGQFSAHAGADLYCLPETLQWLAFEYSQSPHVKKAVLVKTGNQSIAVRWEAESPGSVTPDEPLCWAIYEAQESAAAAQPIGNRSQSARLFPSADKEKTTEDMMQINRGQVIRRIGVVGDVLAKLHSTASQVRFGGVYDGSLGLTGAGVGTTVTRCRFIPDELFKRLAAGYPDDTSVHSEPLWCIQIGGHPQLNNAEMRLDGRRIRVAQAFPGASFVLLLPASLRTSLCPAAEMSGVALWSEWPWVSELENLVDTITASLNLMHFVGPTVFVSVREADMDSCRQWLGSDQRDCSLIEVYMLESEVHAGSQRLASVCVTPVRAGSMEVNRCSFPSLATDSQEAIINVQGYQHTVELGHSSSVPPGIAVLDESVFRRVAFESATALGNLAGVGTSRADVRLRALHFGKAQQALAAENLVARPLVPIREQRLLRFRVTDHERDNGRVGEELVRVLSMTKPTFAAVVPSLVFEAELAGHIMLQGSTPEDPYRFQAELLHGGWLTNESRNEIILPATKAKELTQGRDIRECLGIVVEVQFGRDSRIAASERALSLPLKVVGLVEADAAVVPLMLLQQIVLWSENKVVFNDSQRTFETPTAIYARRGHIRCNIHAKDLRSVEPLVGRLRQMGYRTEDSLADQQGLRRLGQALGFVVIAFGLGCLVIAGGMIVVTTIMNVHTKRWEIGILKAHGMKSSSILSIFAIQGGVVGVNAFLVGVGFVAALEPVLRRWIAASFKIPMEMVVTGSLWSLDMSWLLGAALAVALLLSTLGMVLPAIEASVKLPVQTLKRRE